MTLRLNFSVTKRPISVSMASLGCFAGGSTKSGEEDLDGEGDVDSDGDCEYLVDLG